MAQLYPGILYATLAGVPGFWLGSLLAAPRLRERPIDEIVTTLLRATPHMFLLYAIPTLIYGAMAWWCLRLLGLLNLPALIIAGAIPIIGYFAWSIAMYGWESRAPLAFLAFWLPTLFISVALWWFTIYGRAGA